MLFFNDRFKHNDNMRYYNSEDFLILFFNASKTLTDSFVTDN